VRTGIVLAGGRAARFGADKLTEPVDGNALLDRAIDAVWAVADEVIVAGRVVAGRSPSIRSIPDSEPFGGPLAAMRDAIRLARGTAGVVVGGDMPDLVSGVLRLMIERLEAEPSVDAVILGRPDAGSDRGSDPGAPRAVLPVAIRVEAAGAAADGALSGGRRSLHSLLDHLAWIELPAPAWLGLDPGARTLLDVDTRADLERIRAAKGR